MTDDFQCDDTPVFAPMTTDVEALRDEAYNNGYKDGMEKGREVGFNEGYRERGGDIIARLRMMQEVGMDFGACLSELERMV